MLLIDGEGHDDPDAGVHDLTALLDAAEPAGPIARTEPEEMAMLHFTSGTTGMPKGAVHVHEAVVSHHTTANFALDLGPDDVFWCTADPGWVTGTGYGIIGPLPTASPASSTKPSSTHAVGTRRCTTSA